MADTTGWGEVLMALMSIVVPLCAAWLLIGWSLRRKMVRHTSPARHKH